jgi:hypothetical protein
MFINACWRIAVCWFSRTVIVPFREKTQGSGDGDAVDLRKD